MSEGVLIFITNSSDKEAANKLVHLVSQQLIHIKSTLSFSSGNLGFARTEALWSRMEEWPAQGSLSTPVNFCEGY